MSHALVVDDDSDSAETMAMLIANEGFTVATAARFMASRADPWADMGAVRQRLPDLPAA